MTNPLSRRGFNHPAQGAAGDATLYSNIEAIYQALGDADPFRWFLSLSLANGATVTLAHNLFISFSELTFRFYSYTGTFTPLSTALTRVAQSGSGISVVATSGFATSKVDITNNTGGTLNIATLLCGARFAEQLSDLSDIDFSTAPADGQALVYLASSSKWLPGASGDASFKLQTVATPNLTLKGGYLLLDDERELATYSGSGSVAASFGVDLTVSLTTIFGSAPANATAYYLYLDLNTLATTPTTLTDNGRKLYPITISNFVISTITPESRDPSRYVPIGFVRSATTGTAWSGSGAAFGTMATRRHESLTRFFAYPQTYATTVTSAVASTTLSHNLSGLPQQVRVAYFDGTNEIGLDPASYILDVNASSIKVSSLGLTFGGSQALRVYAVYFPQQPNLASSARQFTSAWFTSNATTTLPHGLNDVDDIKGYIVQEWDVAAVKYRNVDASGLVVNFDGTNFYLDWTGLSPSSTLKYRVVAGGSPNPNAIPLQYGGFTKFVGLGSGSYAKLSDAIAAAAPGDSILINRDFTETADVNVNVADLRIQWMPGVKMTMSGSLTNGLRVTAARVHLERPRLALAPTGTQAKGISVEAADCTVDRALIELTTAQTLTDAVNVASTGVRKYVTASVLLTLGTLTNLLTDADGAGLVNVWGG